MTVEEAQSRLSEMIGTLPPGAEIVLTRNEQNVAVLRSTPKQRQLGTLKGTILYIAPDFDAIPEGFEDYI